MVRKRPGKGRETSWLWSEMIRRRSGIGAKMVENVQKSGQQNLRQKCINHERICCHHGTYLGKYDAKFLSYLRLRQWMNMIELRMASMAFQSSGQF